MTETSFLAAFAAFFVAAASPGPATLAVATTAMAHGRRTALRLGIGLSVGLAAWGVVAAVGLGAVLARSATALLVLRVAGGAYLLFLAVMSARSALSPGPSAAMPTAAAARPVLRGLLLNLTNPKAVLAWLAVLALGVGPGEGPAVLAALTLGLGLTGAAIYVTYALCFALPGMRAAYRRGRRAIEAAAAGFFALAGLRLVFTRTPG